MDGKHKTPNNFLILIINFITINNYYNVFSACLYQQPTYMTLDSWYRLQ